MDSRTSQTVANLSAAVDELLQFKAQTSAKLTTLTHEIATLKLKYANLRSPALFEINDFEKELRGIDVKLQGMQDEISRLTADLVDFTNKLGERKEK